jgi:dihydroorotase
MIDPHVHLRDDRQAHKETLSHGLSVAWRAGLDGVFEMPNTDPPLTTRDAILRRMEKADKAIASLGVPIFHGLYAGLTADPAQIEQAVTAWREFFPRVVGLKMFAGHSTGNMGITGREAQGKVYGRLVDLGFTGVLAVHCEKEELLHAGNWDPARPSSHAEARPPAAEVASVDEQKELARESRFGGTLHVCHVSAPWAVDLLRDTHADKPAAQSPPGFRATCGLTPHHALLDSGMMDRPHGVFLKTNPPLRSKPMPQEMLGRLLAGRIDWIETDHAPHTSKEKTEGFASGVPGLPFYPRFLVLLRARGMQPALLDSLTHDNICAVFGIRIPNRRRTAETDLAGEYEFDPFESVKG